MEAKITVVTITPEGVVTNLEIENTLEALQGLVGGYIEHVALKDGASMFVNEEGLMLGLPPNELANTLVATHRLRDILGHLVGTVVVVGSADAEGDCTSVPSWVLEYLTH